MNTRAFTWFCILLIGGAVTLVAVVESRRPIMPIVHRAPPDMPQTELLFRSADGGELRVRLNGSYWHIETR